MEWDEMGWAALLIQCISIAVLRGARKSASRVFTSALVLVTSINEYA